jgi:hypothetical protein
MKPFKQVTILPEDFNSVKVYKPNPFGTDVIVFTKFICEHYRRSNDCPLARALKRKLNIDNISIDMFGIECIVHGKTFEFEYPTTVGIDEIGKVCDRALKNGSAVLRFGCSVELKLKKSVK